MGEMPLFSYKNALREMRLILRKIDRKMFCYSFATCRMPTLYKRKAGGTRKLWSPENLEAAIKDVKEGLMNYRQAESTYGVPVRTLVRYMTSNKSVHPRLGPDSK